MKRIIALLLALVTVLAFVSCDVQKPCDNCVDADGDLVCDVCGEKIEDEKQPSEEVAKLTVADFAKAMKDMGATRVEIAVTETSVLGTLASTYKVTFGSSETATIAYTRELWNVSEDIFSSTAPAKTVVNDTIYYSNGTYTSEKGMDGTAGVVAKLALNLAADQLASVQINGTAATGAQLIAAVPRANSASVLGVKLPADAAISVTMNAGAKSISAFTLSYADGENQIAFSALYQ